MWWYDTFFLEQLRGKQTSNKERKKMIKSTKVDIDEIALNEIKKDNKSFKELCWNYFVKNEREIYKYNSETKKFDFIDKVMPFTNEVGFMESRNETIIVWGNYFFYFDDDEKFCYFIEKNWEIKKYEIVGWVSPVYSLKNETDQFSFEMSSFGNKSDLYILFKNNNLSIIEVEKNISYTVDHPLFDFNDEHFNLSLNLRDKNKFDYFYPKSASNEDLFLWINFDYSFPITDYSFIKEINLAKMFDYWMFRIRYHKVPKNDVLFCFANGIKWYYLFSKIKWLEKCKHLLSIYKIKDIKTNLFLKNFDKEFKCNYTEFTQQERFEVFNVLKQYKVYKRVNLLLENNNKVFCYFF